MITEWQPVLPGDTLKLKARVIYEFLCSNHRTFLIVGQGPDKEANVDTLIKEDDVVAYREFETRELKSAAWIVDNAQKGKKP